MSKRQFGGGVVYLAVCSPTSMEARAETPDRNLETVTEVEATEALLSWLAP